MKQMKFGFKQAGVTLIELIVGLVIIALIVAGALSLFGTAQSSQTSTQMVQDLTSLRSTTKALFLGQGNYGTASANLNDLLVTAKRVPSTILVDTATTPDTLTHALNGTLNVAVGATNNQFTITLTNIPADVCIPLMAGAREWVSVKAGSAAARTTFPISTANASTDCQTGTTMVFTGS
jgi:prepilin-type N-terminal cleavage/methylation domain-containing protein